MSRDWNSRSFYSQFKLWSVSINLKSRHFTCHLTFHFPPEIVDLSPYFFLSFLYYFTLQGGVSEMITCICLLVLARVGKCIGEPCLNRSTRRWKHVNHGRGIRQMWPGGFKVVANHGIIRYRWHTNMGITSKLVPIGAVNEIVTYCQRITGFCDLFALFQQEITWFLITQNFEISWDDLWSSFQFTLSKKINK